jgi:hypothetical protein
MLKYVRLSMQTMRLGTNPHAAWHKVPTSRSNRSSASGRNSRLRSRNGAVEAQRLAEGGFQEREVVQFPSRGQVWRVDVDWGGQCAEFLAKRVLDLGMERELVNEVG